MRISRTVITLLAVLALIAAPVAARTLTASSDEAPATSPTAAPTAPAGIAPHPAQLSRAPWATLLTPPLAPGIPSDPAAARRAAARTAARTAVAAAAREDAAVLVDKRRGLPATYRPRDLVVPRVRFLAGTSEEGHRLRRRPARALERLFAAARRDGVPLAAVSGYRSYASQRALFSGYAIERGAESASHVSARAGHSEHQTGLAVDVSGADGRCAASRCFSGSRPARWLAAHAAEHGFVIRYPRGREHVTGYDYEPWHLRYTGTVLASEATSSGRTLDQLLRDR